MKTSVPPPDDDARARAAIRDDLDATLVIEAAAGTGKTTELVNRILRVLEAGPTTMEEIVAVTFTEKAAGELKLRIREAIETARSKARDVAELARLDAALERLEEAHVNTIHGFCRRADSGTPVEARVDPLFGVLTELQAEHLYTRGIPRVAAGSAGQPAGRRSAARFAERAPDVRRHGRR